MDIILDENFIEEVKAHNDIVDVISKYVSLKKSGKNYKGLCPFHKEKTPSFIVSEEKQFFHCFGCSESGDVITFIMKMENLDFPSAVILLGEWVGIYPDKNSLSEKEKTEISRKNTIYKINREAAIFYYKNLHKKHLFGLRYLYRRGLDIRTIKKFGLGYADDQWDSLNSYLLDKGYDQKSICDAGLAIEKKNKDGFYDRFRKRIIFPIFNATGKIIGFGGRAIDTETIPKYLNSPETPVFQKGSHLYGLNFAKRAVGLEKQIIVVEGYMDVLSLYQHGFKNVVASLGTSLTKQHVELLKRYASEILIAYDADAAGQAATLRGLDLFSEAGCSLRIIQFPEGQDPDEFILKNGNQAFADKILQASPLVDYKIMLAKQQNDLATAEGKIQFVRAVTKIIRQLKSSVEKDAYIQKVAQESQISIEAIQSEVYGNSHYLYLNEKKPIFSNAKYRSKSDRHNNRYKIKPVQPIQKSRHIEAERCLLKILITYPESFPKIHEIISYDDFTDSTHGKIAKIIYDLYIEKRSISLEAIQNQLTEDENKVFEQIQNQMIPEENLEKALQDYRDAIRNYKLLMEKNEIQKELHLLEKLENKSQDQVARIKELCIYYERILKELKKL